MRSSCVLLSLLTNAKLLRGEVVKMDSQACERQGLKQIQKLVEIMGALGIRLPSQCRVISLSNGSVTHKFCVALLKYTTLVRLSNLAKGDT